jgi:hypothetical protein
MRLLWRRAHAHLKPSWTITLPQVLDAFEASADAEAALSLKSVPEMASDHPNGDWQ